MRTGDRKASSGIGDRLFWKQIPLIPQGDKGE
jgi:hypothetical protein